MVIIHSTFDGTLNQRGNYTLAVLQTEMVMHERLIAGCTWFIIFPNMLTSIQEKFTPCRINYVRAHLNLILLAHKFQNIIMKHIGNEEFCRCMPNHSSRISMMPAIVLCASQTYGLNEKMLVTSLRTSSMHPRTISVAAAAQHMCSENFSIWVDIS